MNSTTRPRIFDRNGGWSNDCIWIRSSLTIPLVPEEIPIRLTSRACTVSGAGEAAEDPPRSAPMASISSMNPMAPPSRRAALRSARKKERIFTFVMPNHIDWNAGADANRNGTPACLAMALAM
jgi:hypothetical protein